jgi:undecaprenyl diphosphate synthase
MTVLTRPVSTAGSSLLSQIDRNRIPQHIAIIMDGNGRWARQRHLPRVFGHRSGIDSVRDIVRVCGELGIDSLTLYAFSSENWARPATEVRALMKLMQEFLGRELPELQKNNVRLQSIGRLDALPSGARNKLNEVIAATAANKGLRLTLALNYGGRQEIVDACNKILASGATQVDEKTFARYLYAPDVPDPDLLIRTSGEMRISNFLLWQIAYTELYVTPILWPEFRRTQLYEAILDYQRRDRRFGGI